MFASVLPLQLDIVIEELSKAYEEAVDGLFTFAGSQPERVIEGIPPPGEAVIRITADIVGKGHVDPDTCQAIYAKRIKVG